MGSDDMQRLHKASVTARIYAKASMHQALANGDNVLDTVMTGYVYVHVHHCSPGEAT